MDVGPRHADTRRTIVDYTNGGEGHVASRIDKNDILLSSLESDWLPPGAKTPRLHGAKSPRLSHDASTPRLGNQMSLVRLKGTRAQFPRIAWLSTLNADALVALTPALIVPLSPREIITKQSPSPALLNHDSGHENKRHTMDRPLAQTLSSSFAKTKEWLGKSLHWYSAPSRFVLLY